MTPTKSSRPRRSKIWIPLILILLAAAGGFGYYYWNQKNAVPSVSNTTTTGSSKMTTKQVRTGSISLVASGSVTLGASQETDLAFTVSGTVAKLNVAVGDQVKKGDILAQLDNLDELQADIKNVEQDLLSAQQDLATFKSQAASNLASAQLKVIDAQKAVEDKQSSVVQKDWQRCDQDTKDAYYNRYKKAVDKLEALGDGGGSADYLLNVINPQKRIVDQALAAYKACDGYTEYQVASSQANLSVAQATLQQAQETLDTLTKNNGLDPIALATAENKVDTAQQALDSANDDLAGATLKAPFDGTILSVDGKAGDTIEVTTQSSRAVFITIADLAHPLLQYSIDETDMSMIAKGETAEVTFDAFANRTFKGAVTRIDPALSSNNGTSMVSGIIQLDLSQEKDVPAFPKNLTGSVLIIQAAAENVLLIPMEALLPQSDGTYAVYVVGADGKPTMKTVQVGLTDVASAEIKNGLTANDVVITSKVQ
jgi:RND family efflux transporter MFP subunit